MSIEPRPGARQSFTHASALRLLSEVCGVSVLDLVPVNSGYNNEIYIASIKPGSSSLPIPTGAQSLVVRFSNPPPGQTRRKTESEVAVLRLIEQYAPDLPVPRVYAWDNDAGNPYGSEYIVESFLPGVPLTEARELLATDADSEAFVVDLARVYAEIKKVPIPGEQFGGFAFDEGTGAVIIKEHVLGYGGPVTSLRDYYQQYLVAQLAAAQTNPFLDGFKLFPSLAARLSVSTLTELVNRVVTEGDMRPTLIHGDFDVANLLLDPTTKRISGILDFEYAYAGPPFEEHCLGFLALGEWELADVFLPDDSASPVDSKTHRRLRALATRLDEPDAAVLGSRTRLFLAELVKYRAFVPADIDLEPYLALYWLGQEICPWTFTQEMPDAYWEKSGPELRVQDTADSISRLLDVLEAC